MQLRIRQGKNAWTCVTDVNVVNDEKNKRSTIGVVLVVVQTFKNSCVVVVVKVYSEMF